MSHRQVRSYGPRTLISLLAFMLIASLSYVVTPSTAGADDTLEALTGAFAEVAQALEATGEVVEDAATKSELPRVQQGLQDAEKAAQESDLETAASQLRTAKTWLRHIIAKAGERGEKDELEPAAREALGKLDQALARTISAPTGFGVLLPAAALETDTVTGLVVADNEAGVADPNSLVGEQLEVAYGQIVETVLVQEGGRFTVPQRIIEAGAGPLQFVIRRPFLNRTAPPVLRNVAVVEPPVGDPETEIATATPALSTDGVITVSGQGLGGLQNPRLESAQGQKVPIKQPAVGSSLQRIYPLVVGVPRGSYRFAAEDAEGRPLTAPNETVRPTVQIKTQSVAREGAKGAVTLSSNTDLWIRLEGGEPQISLSKRLVQVKSGQSVRVPFTANVIGPYSVSAVYDDEPIPERADLAQDCTTETLGVDARYRPGQDDTLVTVRTRTMTTDRKPRPVRQAQVSTLLRHPRGIEYLTATTRNNGIGIMTTTVPGRLTPELLSPVILTGMNAGYRWTAVNTAMPNIWFGTGSLTGAGGTSKDPPSETPDDNDDTNAGPISDIVTFVDNFNKATKDCKEFEVTLYADQPGKGGDRDVIEGGDVGHTFIGIKCDKHEIKVGFYPKTGYSRTDVVTGAEKDGQPTNDKDHPWEVKKTWKVTPENVEKIKQQIKKWKDKKYNLRSANCTDFALDCLKAGGVEVPKANKSSWPWPMDHVNSNNPGDLGEEMAGSGGVRNKP